MSFIDIYNDYLLQKGELCDATLQHLFPTYHQLKENINARSLYDLYLHISALCTEGNISIITSIVQELLQSAPTHYPSEVTEHSFSQAQEILTHLFTLSPSTLCVYIINYLTYAVRSSQMSVISSQYHQFLMTQQLDTTIPMDFLPFINADIPPQHMFALNFTSIQQCLESLGRPPLLAAGQDGQLEVLRLLTSIPSIDIDARLWKCTNPTMREKDCEIRLVNALRAKQSPTVIDRLNLFGSGPYHPLTVVPAVDTIFPITLPHHKSSLLDDKHQGSPLHAIQRQIMTIYGHDKPITHCDMISATLFIIRTTDIPSELQSIPNTEQGSPQHTIVPPQALYALLISPYYPLLFALVERLKASNQRKVTQRQALYESDPVLYSPVPQGEIIRPPQLVELPPVSTTNPWFTPPSSPSVTEGHFRPLTINKPNEVAYAHITEDLRWARLSTDGNKLQQDRMKQILQEQSNLQTNCADHINENDDNSHDEFASYPQSSQDHLRSVKQSLTHEQWLQYQRFPFSFPLQFYLEHPYLRKRTYFIRSKPIPRAKLNDYLDCITFIASLGAQLILTPLYFIADYIGLLAAMMATDHSKPMTLPEFNKDLFTMYNIQYLPPYYLEHHYYSRYLASTPIQFPGSSNARLLSLDKLNLLANYYTRLSHYYIPIPLSIPELLPNDALAANARTALRLGMVRYQRRWSQCNDMLLDRCMASVGYHRFPSGHRLNHINGHPWKYGYFTTTTSPPSTSQLPTSDGTPQLTHISASESLFETGHDGFESSRGISTNPNPLRAVGIRTMKDDEVSQTIKASVISKRSLDFSLGITELPPPVYCPILSDSMTQTYCQFKSHVNESAEQFYDQQSSSFPQWVSTSLKIPPFMLTRCKTRHFIPNNKQSQGNMPQKDYYPPWMEKTFHILHRSFPEQCRLYVINSPLSIMYLVKLQALQMAKKKKSAVITTHKSKKGSDLKSKSKTTDKKKDKSTTEPRTIGGVGQVRRKVEQLIAQDDTRRRGVQSQSNPSSVVKYHKPIAPASAQQQPSLSSQKGMPAQQAKLQLSKHDEHDLMKPSGARPRSSRPVSKKQSVGCDNSGNADNVKTTLACNAEPQEIAPSPGKHTTGLASVPDQDASPEPQEQQEQVRSEKTSRDLPRYSHPSLTTAITSFHDLQRYRVWMKSSLEKPFVHYDIDDSDDEHPIYHTLFHLYATKVLPYLAYHYPHLDIKSRVAVTPSNTITDAALATLSTQSVKLIISSIPVFERLIFPPHYRALITHLVKVRQYLCEHKQSHQGRSSNSTSPQSSFDLLNSSSIVMGGMWNPDNGNNQQRQHDLNRQLISPTPTANTHLHEIDFSTQDYYVTSDLVNAQHMAQTVASLVMLFAGQSTYASRSNFMYTSKLPTPGMTFR